MELHEFADRAPRQDPLRTSMARLIEVVGSPRFESEIFQIARTAIACEHVTAFAFTREATPRILLAANTGPQPVARAVADKYVKRYWRLDPANGAGIAGRKSKATRAVRTQPQDIDDGSYRQECYTAVRLQDRFTLIQPRGNEIYRINFYRSGRSGRFADHDIDRIANSADLLMSLLVKHDSLSRGTESAAEPELFVNRLRLLEPTMPLRETEVCAAIMLGMTSEAIALKLGISVNTVLTYRKRAYSRIGISCQNELLRLILS